MAKSKQFRVPKRQVITNCDQSCFKILNIKNWEVSEFTLLYNTRGTFDEITKSKLHTSPRGPQNFGNTVFFSPSSRLSSLDGSDVGITVHASEIQKVYLTLRFLYIRNLEVNSHPKMGMEPGLHFRLFAPPGSLRGTVLLRNERTY